MASRPGIPKLQPKTGLAAGPRRPALNELRQVDEGDRMDAVNSYHLLDTPPDQHLDELTKLAAFICGTSVALIAIAATERHFFKSHYGVDLTESPSAISFCQYAMRNDGVFEVSDATQDPDFQKNPLVVNAPYVRFYAGVPLLTPGGMPLGTLCTLDMVPHELSHEQRDALLILGRQVAAHLELGRARLQLAEEREKIENILRLANSATHSAMVGGWRNEIFVKQENRLVRVLTADILFIEALGDYVSVRTIREQHTVHTTLKEMEAKLPERDFARVHRKYIVRLDRIMSIASDQLVLEIPQTQVGVSSTIPIGGSYRTVLLSRLNQV